MAVLAAAVIVVAQYEGGKADIVVAREDLLPGDSAVYSVYKVDGDTETYLLSLELTGAFGSSTVSRKIVNVEPGTYKVVETSWSWSYGRQDTPAVTPTAQKVDEGTGAGTGTGTGTGTVDFKQTLVFTFSGEPKNEIKHDEDIKVNEFTTASSN